MLLLSLIVIFNVVFSTYNLQGGTVMLILTFCIFSDKCPYGKYPSNWFWQPCFPKNDSKHSDRRENQSEACLYWSKSFNGVWPQAEDLNFPPWDAFSSHLAACDSPGPTVAFSEIRTRSYKKVFCVDLRYNTIKAVWLDSAGIATVSSHLSSPQVECWIKFVHPNKR